MLKVEPSQEALTATNLPREVLREHVNTICTGHLLLFGLCCINILLLSTEGPRVVAKPKRQ